jgi:type IX secretion system PorP/SprF family membrane protein
MKKILFIFISALLIIPKGWSGQDPLYTQFMTNPFLINPALTGTYPYYQIIANNRLQWVNFTDAPLTNTITMYGPMVNQPMGVGGYIMQDRWGPESKINIAGTYAYNYGLTEDLKISMGLMLGFYQHKLDGTDLRVKDNDPYFVPGEIYQNYKPDASVGAYLYSAMYHAGLSVTNLFGNKLVFEDNSDSEENDTTSKSRTTFSKMKRHIYLHGGYKYFLNHEIAIEPTVIFKKVYAAPLQMDMNVRVWYGKRAWDGNKFWGGLSYRTKDALNVMIGFIYQKKIEIGYSYDITLNKTRTYHSGSHELMLSFKFNNIK